MKLLEDRIKRDGKVLEGNVLKVDNFLNHQVDPDLMFEMGEEFARLFRGEGITKILTVESSGIAPAILTGLQLHVPVVFARKHKSLTLVNDMYTSTVYSYTKKVSNEIAISKKFLADTDKVLIIDDFLANGQAVAGLIDICEQAGAVIDGVGIAIEKTFQRGHELIAEKQIRLESLAKITAFKDGKVVFESDQEANNAD
ncbi:xanthine phosphoribosyltransferase [Loigolactobacillus backii]|uniref:Xanthine phosphoribosyltransferase n=1 Tax=Loigolactobacillus backii TaxID=375175 RepID=A0A192H653_9LACO|nr:xanthine phosphoribosyltransferase [Loigolactobacillus backii]ANK60123.1 xanthine phosphoribosyltransferase [Loigolactobacillus backii]ANK63471.1 xanthine phosphoribosyltransferase [Loigolactobacillus backii]ANK65005.1 xanthine phosphoribosyltransferase [Loigolactobacillus backii]ANK66494.1 xanthine phosphoribosyltransferase [Loigolactobacillus backii]ANK69525.1 xanthine phosphoribosyltransferase [Loigolactobacillus backii]